MKAATRRSTCSWEGRSEDRLLATQALAKESLLAPSPCAPSSSVALDLLELQYRLISRPEIDIAAAHFLERFVAFIAAGKPMFLGPVAADQVSERIGGAQLDANSKRTFFGKGRGQVVFVNDGHVSSGYGQ